MSVARGVRRGVSWAARGLPKTAISSGVGGSCGRPPHIGASDSGSGAPATARPPLWPLRPSGDRVRVRGRRTLPAPLRLWPRLSSRVRSLRRSLVRRSLLRSPLCRPALSAFTGRSLRRSLPPGALCLAPEEPKTGSPPPTADAAAWWLRSLMRRSLRRALPPSLLRVVWAGLAPFGSRLVAPCADSLCRALRLTGGGGLLSPNTSPPYTGDECSAG